MAIIGSLATLETQCGGKYKKVLDYLRNADMAGIFASLELGGKKTVEIDGKNIFAIYQTYKTKTHDTARIEGHRQYADVQYIFEGQEIIGYTSIENIDGEPNYDEAKDIFFCNSQKKISHFVVSEGEAVVLEPNDLHAPCMMIDKSETVKKIVFKVKI